jgi:hypothetical protein
MFQYPFPFGVASFTLASVGGLISGVLNAVSGSGESIVTIDGNVYRGRSVEMRKEGVFVDGKEIKSADDKHFKATSIHIEGSLQGNITSTSGKVTISGGGLRGGSITTTSGDVDVRGNVSGSVQTVSGDVSCDTVQGSVNTISGDVNKKVRPRHRDED